MDKPSTDWSLIQSFLAVAETGSLSAAARRLGQSQPTLGRQIRTLEAALGSPLFSRHAKGLHLTETGQALVPDAERMRAAMKAIELTAAGEEQEIQGTVRITASVFAAHYVLPPILARIREEEPAISLVLVPTDVTENLLFREADIAVRMYRPTQLDIVTRHVTSIEMGIFAARSYLDRAGRPERIEELAHHALIGFDQDDQIIRGLQAAGVSMRPEDFAVRCDSHSAYWQLLRAGCGIGFSQAMLGRADPLVEELPFEVGIPVLEVWLAAHPAMRRTPRVGRVWDRLAEGLRQSQLPAAKR